MLQICLPWTSRCQRPALVLEDGAWWSGVATFGLTVLLPLTVFACLTSAALYDVNS